MGGKSGEERFTSLALFFPLWVIQGGVEDVGEGAEKEEGAAATHCKSVVPLTSSRITK